MLIQFPVDMELVRTLHKEAGLIMQGMDRDAKQFAAQVYGLTTDILYARDKEVEAFNKWAQAHADDVIVEVPPTVAGESVEGSVK
jgi:predicted negative regulator of RcsB-dependent stress response